MTGRRDESPPRGRGRHSAGPPPKSAPPSGVPSPSPNGVGGANGMNGSAAPARAVNGPPALGPSPGSPRPATPPSGIRALQRTRTPAHGISLAQPAQSPPRGIRQVRRRRGSLLLAEAGRITARRLVRWLVVLAMFGVAVGAGVVWYLHAPVTADGLVNAQHRLDARMAQIDRARADCLANPPLTFPGGPTVEEICGPPSLQQHFTLNQFLTPAPFVLADDAITGAVGVGAGAAAVAYLISATFIGAEWSSRNLVALLFWESRRGRVMVSKLVVAASASALVAVLMEAAWIPLAMVVARTKGNPVITEVFWHDLLTEQARCVWLAVLAGIAGFAVANLVRGTAGALGLAFVYFAVVEAAVRAFWAPGIPYLLSSYAAGLLLQGGYVITPVNARLTGAPDIVISNQQAGAVLTVLCLAVTLWGIHRFRRRDIQ